jgi:WD40 repeat protein
MVQLWDPDSGKQLRQLVGHTHIVGALSWSPDSQTLASGSWDTTVSLWAVGDQPGGTIPGDVQWAYNLPLWSPDGKYLVTGAVNARLWSAATGELLHAFPEHVGVARAWSPDSQSLTTTDWKGGFWIHDVADYSPRCRIQPGDQPLRAAAWSPDGRLLATGDDGARVLLSGANGDGGWKKGNAPGWQTLTAYPSATEGIKTVAFSPDNATLAAAGPDGAVLIWDVKERKKWVKRELHKGCVRALAWSKNGRMIASGGEDRVVKICEAKSGKVLKTLTGFHAEIWSLAFSPDSTTLATADGWSDVCLWEPGSGLLLRRLHGPTAPALSLTWSPDSKRLAAGGELATTHIWDVDSGQAKAVLLGLPRDRALAVGSTGHYRCTPGVERDLVYVVQTDRGQETLTPSEFARKYNWKNDPAQVRPMGP